MKPLKTALCLTLCFLLLVPCGCRKKSSAPQDATIYYNLTHEPDSLDPQIADDPSARLIVTNLFEGLVRLDENECIIPGAAKSWSISDDGRVYSFRLREDAKWSDKTSVTAEDFYFGICRALSPETGCKNVSDFFSIKNAEKVYKGELPLSSLGVYPSDDTLIIELELADPDFLSSLTSPAAMPCRKAFFEDTCGQYGREPDKLISNGAFSVGSCDWTPGVSLHLRKNTAYKGENEPIPAGVFISFKETPASACQEIENGAVDCCPLPENELALAKAEQLPLTAYSQDVFGITFNTQYELFCHKTIRNALLSSLQRSALIDLLPKEHLSLSSLSEMCDTSDNTGGLFDILSKIAVPYDAHAADTLKKAMDQLGAQTFPKLTILCDDDPDTQQVVNALIERWNTLTDRYINKEPLPRDELKKRIRSGDYFAAIAPVPINSNDPLSFLETFSSDSAYNPADLSDPVFDERLHRLHTTARSDLSEMRNTLRYLLEEGIFYPLYAENNYFVCAKNVSGIVFHAQDGFVDFSAARKTSD